MAEAMTVARSRRKRTEPAPDLAPDTPDPIEIALKAVAADADGHPLARAVLEKHAKLLDVQCQREREEWSVLRVQRWTRWLILAAVLALLAGLAALLWTASRSTSLVIEPFEVPAPLVQRGLSGKVVSARVLDRLAELQRNTESMRGAKSYANDWQGDIKLDIPQTGLSIGEAWRSLKGWLGTQTTIGGEVTLAPDGSIAITTRAGAESGGTVAGPAAEFDRLVGEAAAGLYRVTQPYRYAISRPDKNEGIRVLNELTGAESELERKWAYSGLAASYRTIGQPARSLAMAQRALAIDPDLLPALGNEGLAYLRLGRLPEAIATFRRLDVAYRAVIDDDMYDTRIARLNRLNTLGIKAEIFGDAPALRALSTEIEGFSGSSFAPLSASWRRSAALVAHDPLTAAAVALPTGRDPEDAADNTVSDALGKLDLAVARGDPVAVRAAALLWSTQVATLPAELRASREIFSRPVVAIALAKAGLPRTAAAVAAKLPAGCYDCVRARGWAAVAAGDRPAARRLFAEAVRQGPDLPAGRVDLGRLDALEGRTNAALAQFREAARLAPNWADPARFEGDVLARSGRLKQARTAYDRAAKLAPAWGVLRLQQGRVLAALGERAAAAVAFAAADRALLPPADRARLAAARATLN